MASSKRKFHLLQASLTHVFEFYALDIKLDLPANTTREELLKAMDGHVVGKAAWFGRFHAQPTP
jgi:phosphatidylethanolamine-binding protein (PEBP) family uncharacterized protein